MVVKLFPQIFACKISTTTDTPTIWGYSEYQNSPKYRTLGLSLEAWIKQVMYTANQVCEFYDVHDEAIDRIKKFTSVKKSSPNLKEYWLLLINKHDRSIHVY